MSLSAPGISGAEVSKRSVSYAGSIHDQPASPQAQRSTPRRVELRIEPPFGVVPGKTFDVQEFSLEPGDRIVLLTDGMQERNAMNLDVADALAKSADLHPREVVHELGSAILQATGGDLKDDATMVCLDWYGGPPRGRNSEQGADPDRASAPV